MESIWRKTAEIPPYPPLPGDLSTEVAVIGGGLAGILTAHALQERGVKVIVLEASRIGSGQTGNTSAKVTAQHGLIYDKLIREFGMEKARQYADANRQAIEEYHRIIEKKGIDCEFMQVPAYLYTTAERDLPDLEREVTAAQTLGFEAVLTENTSLPFPVAGAVRFSGQAQFHPLKFLRAIAADLAVFEQTRVTSVEGHKVLTDRGTVTADHIVFATHFPFPNLPGLYFARMHQSRSYVLALKQAGDLDGVYLEVGEDGFSLRRSGEYLLLGGGDHRTGDNRTGGKYELLRRQAELWYPGSREAAHWSAQDCMPQDEVPYIGQFAPSAPYWYVATGFRKWGMTSSMVSALILSTLITGSESPIAEVFSPGRFTPAASLKAFLADSGQAVKGLSRQLFQPPRAELDALPKCHGGIVESGGQKVGVYKDEEGRIYLVSTRCPHLGCQLEWNPDEKSWDCPCHGSRFDYTGQLLDNPAQEHLREDDHA